MSRIQHLSPKFVDLMPQQLEPGTLYISVQYLILVHLCASGCGEKVVLPLHPQQWQFSYDGAEVSVSPSVGNIGLACNSHYWIKRGRIAWSGTITPQQAKRGHERDRSDLTQSFPEPSPQTQEPPKSLLAHIKRFLRRSS
jgi:hypothetical protein